MATGPGGPASRSRYDSGVLSPATPDDLDDLAAALPAAHQVRLFRSTGQLDREVAWHRPLPVRADSAARLAPG